MGKYTLTDEHRERLPEYARRGIDLAMRTEGMTDEEREICRDAVEELYRAAELEPPPRHRIVFVSSPMVARYAGGWAAWIWSRREESSATDGAVEAAVADSTRAYTQRATALAAYGATLGATGLATLSATYDATQAVTLDATELATRDATVRATLDATAEVAYDVTQRATWGVAAAATAGATWEAAEATYDATAGATRHTTERATERATWDATYDATYEATQDAAADATYAATYDATARATKDAVRVKTHLTTRRVTQRATWDATLDATARASRDATWAATEDSTEAATRGQAADAIDDATQRATPDATRAATWDATLDDHAWYTGAPRVPRVVRMCARSAYRMEDSGNQRAGLWCWLEFMREVAELPIDWAPWSSYATLAEHSGPRVMHEKFCIIADFPEVLLVDEESRPHCEDGPFCRWRDGVSLYAVHGTRVPAWLIEDPDRLTVERIDAEENAEVRRVMIERYGLERYMLDTGAEVISEAIDEGGQPMRLLRREQEDDEAIVVAHLLNSTLDPDGSRREYLIRVPPTMVDIWAARNWTAGLPADARFTAVS